MKSVQSLFSDIDLTNNFAIIVLARKGVHTKVFYDFAEAVKMPEKTLAAMINLSSRTISNYKESNKPLDPQYGEHLLKIMALYSKGEVIFGNVSEFNYWLSKPLWSSVEKPLNWLSTSGGIDFVSEELDKLAQGYPA
jgi:putative toxin-antitoxin system antitoxin component (TIGR02293 family)